MRRRAFLDITDSSLTSPGLMQIRSVASHALRRDRVLPPRPPRLRLELDATWPPVRLAPPPTRAQLPRRQVSPPSPQTHPEGNSSRAQRPCRPRLRRACGPLTRSEPNIAPTHAPISRRHPTRRVGSVRPALWLPVLPQDRLRTVRRPRSRPPWARWISTLSPDSPDTCSRASRMPPR